MVRKDRELQLSLKMVEAVSSYNKRMREIDEASSPQQYKLSLMKTASTAFLQGVTSITLEMIEVANHG